MERRTFLGSITSATVASLAGCSDETSETSDDPETVGEWADGTIEFGLPPFQNAEELERQYAGVFEYLEGRFDGVESVEGVQTTSYSATVESVIGGHTELANLSPIIYVLAAEEGVEPLAINWSHGSEAYHSYIATREGMEIDALEDLKGHTIAMVDPLSTSGGLFPRYMLAKAGLEVGDLDSPPEDVDIEWAGGHDSSVAALQNGHVDAAAYGDFQHPDDDAIVTIAESEPIPFDPMVARPGTPESVQSELIDALLATPKEALEEHRIDRFGEVEPDTYDPVRDVAVEMGVEIEQLEPDDE